MSPERRLNGRAVMKMALYLLGKRPLEVWLFACLVTSGTSLTFFPRYIFGDIRYIFGDIWY